MKKLVTSLIAVILIFTLSPLASSAASKPIKVFYNGNQLKFDVNPIVENGTTLVEFKSLFNALGLSIGYNQFTKKVTGKKGNLNIELTIGSKTAYVKGQKKTLDVPAKIKNGRTLVPLRFVGQSTGANVEWDSKNQIINIKKSSLNEEPTVPNPQPEEPVKPSVLQLGQTFSNNKAEVTIKSVEYSDIGFKVYFDVYNKSNTPLKTPGALLFKLDQPQYEKEIASMGYSINFDGAYVYQGESKSGYYEWSFNKNVKIKEIEYYLMDTGEIRTPLAIWKAE